MTITQICRHDPRDIGCNRETCDKSFSNELVTCAVLLGNLLSTDQVRNKAEMMDFI